jgi:hypothetical protein
VTVSLSYGTKELSSSVLLAWIWDKYSFIIIITTTTYIGYMTKKGSFHCVNRSSCLKTMEEMGDTNVPSTAPEEMRQDDVEMRNNDYYDEPPPRLMITKMVRYPTVIT